MSKLCKYIFRIFKVSFFIFSFSHAQLYHRKLSIAQLSQTVYNSFAFYLTRQSDWFVSFSEHLIILKMYSISTCQVLALILVSFNFWNFSNNTCKYVFNHVQKLAIFARSFAEIKFLHRWKISTVFTDEWFLKDKT